MAYKLARVAAGLDDGLFCLGPHKQWGTCAGTALVAAGGGVVTLTDGSPAGFNQLEVRHRLGMIAAGPKLHSLLLARVSQWGDITLAHAAGETRG
jgi:3'-phosphoadenosine 5'-phosphosulfate (PAPS) 3'-phosphatase